MSEINGKPHGPSRIYWIGGSKGGVGKSMMTVVILDYLLEQGEKVLLVECDTSNPDVWKAYSNEMEGELINLDVAYGWIRLVNACDVDRSRVATGGSPRGGARPRPVNRRAGAYQLCRGQFAAGRRAFGGGRRAPSTQISGRTVGSAMVESGGRRDQRTSL
ncbi:MAG: hypothetical protein ACLP1X_10970 [Polyangiaceae bacterium]